MGLELFPVDWQVADRRGSQCTVTCYAKTGDGRSVAAHIRWFPSFYVALPPDPQAAHRLAGRLLAEHGALKAASQIVQRKSLWGFSQETQPFLLLAFATLAKHSRAKYAIRRTHRTFEGDVDPLLRLFHVRNVAPGRWVRLQSCKPEPMRTTVSDIEVICDYSDVFPSDRSDPPPLLLCSWDIECVSASRTTFPKASSEGDKIVCIGSVFGRLGEARSERVAFVLGDCAPNDLPEFDGTEFVSCSSEADLLRRWIDRVVERKADIMLGWNTWGFDLPYVYGRCDGVLLDDESGQPLVDLSKFGRDRPLPALTEEEQEEQQPAKFAPMRAGQLKTWTLQSGAYGVNNFSVINTPGILQFDLMQSVKRSANLESYSLKAVTAHYLPQQGNKLDMSPMQLFESFERGSPEDILQIAQYCVRDCELPLLLSNALSSISNDLEMASACSVPFSFLLSRGQQVKVFSQVLKKARQMGFVCPDNAGISIEGKYEGATVLEPVTGAHMEPTTCMDFASLYPSIMRAHNLCYSTIVLDPMYSNIPGVEYKTVETGLGTFKFVQNSENRGVLPALLEELAEFRKDARKRQKEMEAAGDVFAAKVCNAAQLAYKISMNSVYGFAGASKGFLPLPYIAACVTSVGRDMIETTAQAVLRLNPGSRIIYGDTDSVMCILRVPGDDQQDIRAHFVEGRRLAKEITGLFPKPIELEHEKVMVPYLLYKKKRYASLAYSDPDDKPKRDVKGLALVRRDSCPLVKQVSENILDALLHDRSASKALAIAQDAAHDLLSGKVPIEQLTITKAFRSGYKPGTCLPHASVAAKILQRTTVPVASGTRVPFVYLLDHSNPDTLGHLKAEDVGFAVENKLQIDYLHYWDSQLSSPIESLLEVVCPDPLRQIVASEKVAGVLKQLREEFAVLARDSKRVRVNAANKQLPLTSFFSPAAPAP